MWILLAIGSAFFLAASDVFCKKALENSSAVEVAWARFGLSVPFVLPLLYFAPWPHEPGAYLFWLVVVLPLEIAALFLYIGALQRSDMSLSVPFLAFTPAFILLVAWVILGEQPHVMGIAGVLCISLGAYILSVRDDSKGIWGPFKSFAREPGSIMMLGVALLFAFTATIGKKQILLSTPLFLLSTYAACLTVVLTPVLWARGGLSIRKVVKNKLLWAAGGAWALMGLFHVFGIVRAPAAYMVAVKRSSLLFAVLFGIFLFHEGGARYRIPGAILMLAGVFILAWVKGLH